MTALERLETFADRTAWLERRREGLGGSDVARIMTGRGLEVWLERQGATAERPDTPPMAIGRAMEQTVADQFEAHSGLELLRPWPAYAVVQGQEPWMLASPDRLLADRLAGLEMKTHGFRQREQWGEPGSDDVPDAYMWQTLWYMACCDVPTWHVAAWDRDAATMDQALRCYVVQRDRDLEAALLTRVEEWWEAFIRDGAQPPLDGSAAATDFLRRRFPRDSAPLLTATPEQDALGRELLRRRRARAEAESAEAEAENRLKAEIGAAEGIEGAGWRATWKAAKDSAVVDHAKYERALEGALLAAGYAEGQIALMRREFTSTRPGSRRFLLKGEAE